MKRSAKRRRRASRERLTAVIAAAQRRDSAATVEALVAIADSTGGLALMEEVKQFPPETLLFVLPHLALDRPEDDPEAVDLWIGFPEDTHTWHEERRSWIDRDGNPWRPEGIIGPLETRHI